MGASLRAGLWYFVSEDEVATVIGSAAWDDPVTAAAALRDEAFLRGSADNTSVVVAHVA